MKVNFGISARETICLAIVLILAGFSPSSSNAQTEKGKGSQLLTLRFRSQVPTEVNPQNFQFRFQEKKWLPAETAIIVCDFWDYHHCLNAVRRMKEFGPRLNRVIKQARQMGVTIIHSPSDCMGAYQEHPARKRVFTLPKVETPEFAAAWCSQIPAEELSNYPIDQSDGGEDDDPAEHKRWAEKLKSLGRNPNLPWKKQNDMIPIDGERDFVSDRGDEVLTVLKNRNIKNVILTGVHTNMCVLGRPFGLRQMKRFGMNVVLMRDMTDSMYNPARWPFVSHYEGHNRVIAHVEKYVCPTISSNQLIGGKEFAFGSDPRPHLAIVIGESEYKTEQTLPAFAMNNLSDFRVTFVLANPTDRNDFPEVERAQDADVMLLSVRRRVLKPEQMKVFRQFEAAKKPILGIRTASHAFCLRNADAPNGYEDWKSFDSDVFGGNYTNHYGNKLKSKVTFTPLSLQHPITSDLASSDQVDDRKGEIDLKTFGQGGSLYKTSPLAEGASVLLNGSVLGNLPEPAAWTYKRLNGGTSFYTSLGHPEDFENPEFVSLLRNAIQWAAKRKPASPDTNTGKKYWRVIDDIRRPKQKELLQFQLGSDDDLDSLFALVAFRKVIRIPKGWKDQKQLRIRAGKPVQNIWLNGTSLKTEDDESGKYFVVDTTAIDFGEPNWLTVGARFSEKSSDDRSASIQFETGTRKLVLKGDWEWQTAGSDFADESRMYLPAKFGGNPRVYSEFEHRE